MTKTNPCPVCGSAVVYVVSDVGLPWLAQCSECENRGPLSDSHESAVMAWNERADALTYDKERISHNAS